MGWFEDLFIKEAKPALNRHSGSGSGDGSGFDPEDKTFILVDDYGNEIPAVLTDEEVDLTATANDIRLGTLAVTDEGVVEGTKEIPTYISREGFRVITNGSNCTLAIDGYDYTKLQAIFCTFNTTVSNSVAADRIALNDNVYPVMSVDSESIIRKDLENKKIDFGIANSTGKPYLIRYFTFKEET
jgi:hypothetical protein